MRKIAEESLKNQICKVKKNIPPDLVLSLVGYFKIY